jgi:hypothetical protein
MDGNEKSVPSSAQVPLSSRKGVPADQSSRKVRSAIAKRMTLHMSSLLFDVFKEGCTRMQQIKHVIPEASN